MSNIIKMDQQPLCFTCANLKKITTTDGIEQLVCIILLSGIQYLEVEKLDHSRAIVPNVKECQIYTKKNITPQTKPIIH